MKETHNEKIEVPDVNEKVFEGKTVNLIPP